MKTQLIIKVICIQFILIFGQSGFAQRIDYRSEGCKSEMTGPSPTGYQIVEKIDFSESNEIWAAMEELTLSMIDLEVEVIHLRTLERRLIPFHQLSASNEEDLKRESYDPTNQFEMEESMEDKVLYELLQMKSYLQNLINQVSDIKLEVYRFKYFDQQSNSTSDDFERQIGTLPVPNENSRIDVWKEMEEMAIQAMDLEVEISDLRQDLASLQRNAWEIDQIALLKSKERN